MSRRTDILEVARGLKQVLESIDEGEQNDPSFKHLMKLAEDVESRYSVFFPITALHRDDLKSPAINTEEINTDAVTDDQMESIAEAMADAYTGGDSYWIELSTIIEDMEDLPRFTEQIGDGIVIEV